MDATMIVPDGRRLAYAEYGDPQGKPILLFHGMPGSRLFRPSDEITTRMQVRLITIDRPGYGRSDFQPGRRILDWPDDVLAVAGVLGLKRFAVAGHSGGGPYASACAWRLPERVYAAAVLCGAGPIEAPDAAEGMTGLNRFGLQFGRFVPWPLWRVLIGLAYGKRARDPAAVQEAETGSRPSADEEQMHRPEVRETCLLSEVEAFRQGLQGMAWEARLLTRSWGFDLGQIRIPVHLWHGTADNTAPISMGRAVAARIPGCRATFCPDEGHLLLFPHWEEILAALTAG
jgi:pimeloyl-ACP methyl ester carboxylesterase